MHLSIIIIIRLHVSLYYYYKIYRLLLFVSLLFLVYYY